jgi:hypothetical protein
MVMDPEQAVLEKLRTLPDNERQQVLDFIDRLTRRRRRHTGGEDLYGLWADLDISLTSEDLAEARLEMWGDFPKADI